MSLLSFSKARVVFNSGALDAALAAITESGATHMVVFDTGSYIAVLPDGSVIGYSEREDLLAYVTCEMTGGAASVERT